MALMNSANSYGSVAKILHWLIFALVFVMIVGGFFMGDVPKDYKGVIYNLHKLTGVTILLIVLLRLGWKLINVKPRLPADTSVWQRRAERAVHDLLYLLIIAMPLAGWIGSSSAGKAPHIGDFKIALPIPESKSLIETMFEMHEMIAYGIIALVCIHVAAALYHHYVKKDDVLRRMWFS
ncbi:MAG TPA: cytochrome b [Gammaproteobacteria bacterium]|jgi:cytochrome b561|nr:cytochrome b [Gammaproteobacteria bacterium]